MKNSKICFENAIEDFVMTDASEYYYNNVIPKSNHNYLAILADRSNRDIEEAKMMYAALLPYGVLSLRGTKG
jgi:hypothetical protein